MSGARAVVQWVEQLPCMLPTWVWSPASPVVSPNPPGVIPKHSSKSKCPVYHQMWHKAKNNKIKFEKK